MFLYVTLGSGKIHQVGTESLKTPGGGGNKQRLDSPDPCQKYAMQNGFTGHRRALILNIIYFISPYIHLRTFV